MRKVELVFEKRRPYYLNDSCDCLIGPSSVQIYYHGDGAEIRCIANVNRLHRYIVVCLHDR